MLTTLLFSWLYDRSKNRLEVYFREGIPAEALWPTVAKIIMDKAGGIRAEGVALPGNLEHGIQQLLGEMVAATSA